jgi:hypothetical protein
MGTGWSEDVHLAPESDKQGHCSQCATIECAKFRPLACELAPPAADALTGAAASRRLHQDECERSLGWCLRGG